MTDKQWENIIALHNTAPFKLVREAAPYFRVKDGEPRCIINISSTSGVHGNAGQANYGLAKSGINGLTKVIAKEYVYGELIISYSRCLGHRTWPTRSFSDILKEVLQSCPEKSHFSREPSKPSNY